MIAGLEKIIAKRGTLHTVTLLQIREEKPRKQMWISEACP
jgi:hypothetical protein